MADNSVLGKTQENYPVPGPVNGPGGLESQYPPIGKRGTPIEEKIEQILILVYMGVATLLLFRFVLSLFGANRASLFVNFVYQLTTPFMFAFEGMFGTKPAVGNFVLEFEVLVALLVYALVFLGIARLVRIVFK